MELESIQSRIDMSSFILLGAAIITGIYLLFSVLSSGFELLENIITLVTIMLYLGLWKYSYHLPLICFTTGLIIYSANFIYSYKNFVDEPLNLLAYRIVVPVILIIGIGNIFYSWYQIKNIRAKEKEYPEYVKNLIYVIKDIHLYDEERYYDHFATDVDNVEQQQNNIVITLNNGEEYINYTIKHHVYEKYCQVFLLKPIAKQAAIIDAVFNSTLKNESYIFLSILFTAYRQDLVWVDLFIEKAAMLSQKSPQNNKSIIDLSNKIVRELNNPTIVEKFDALFDSPTFS